MNEYTGIAPTPLDPDEGRRRALGAFLRRSRERLAPLEGGRRRRTPGLRREEVAEAAGISVTWYTWLEQCRDVTMSAETVDRLGDALALDGAEKRFLKSLARPRDMTRPEPQAELPTAVATLVRSLAPHPAYAVDRACNVMAWNDPAAHVFSAFVPGDPVKGNILARLYLDPDWKALFADWPLVARSAVAQFRAASAPYADAPDVVDLIGRLSLASPAFATVWSAAELAPSPDWTKVLHRNGSKETWRYSVLRPEGAGKDFTVTLYLPA